MEREMSIKDAEGKHESQVILSNEGRMLMEGGCGVEGMEDEIIRVRDINWDDAEIQRAGIVPICRENGNKWIGLGVSKFSGNITTIGGLCEIVDHDLLSTAVREFNEEVGENMRLLKEEEVYNCYALYSDYTLSIFLPILRRPDRFKETEELLDIIWVTPGQLNIMAKNQECELFRGKKEEGKKEEGKRERGRYTTPKTRAFMFSMDLEFIALGIARVVKEGRCFDSDVSKVVFERPRRIAKIIVPKISTSVEEFAEDSEKYKVWGCTALIITDEVVGIMRRDRKMYLLEHDKMSSIMEGVKRSRAKLLVALTSDLEHPLLRAGREEICCSTQSRMRLSSIEKDMKRARIPQNKFLEDLLSLRAEGKEERITKELNFITYHEAKIYRAMKQKGTMLNKSRTRFLRGVNIVNRLLEGGRGMLYGKLKSTLDGEYGHRNPPCYIIINIMIETGLIRRRGKKYILCS